MNKTDKPKTMFDYLCSLIKGLPPGERTVLDEIATNQPPSDVDVAKGLIRQGLVECDRWCVPGNNGRVEYIYSFEMPVSIHVAWCSVCEQEVKDDAVIDLVPEIDIDPPLIGRGERFRDLLIDHFKSNFQGKLDDVDLDLLRFWLSEAIKHHNNTLEGDRDA